MAGNEKDSIGKSALRSAAITVGAAAGAGIVTAIGVGVVENGKKARLRAIAEEQHRIWSAKLDAERRKEGSIAVERLKFYRRHPTTDVLSAMESRLPLLIEGKDEIAKRQSHIAATRRFVASLAAKTLRKFLEIRHSFPDVADTLVYPDGNSNVGTFYKELPAYHISPAYKKLDVLAGWIDGSLFIFALTHRTMNVATARAALDHHVKGLFDAVPNAIKRVEVLASECHDQLTQIQALHAVPIEVLQLSVIGGFEKPYRRGVLIGDKNLVSMAVKRTSKAFSRRAKEYQNDFSISSDRDLAAGAVITSGSETAQTLEAVQGTCVARVQDLQQTFLDNFREVCVRHRIGPQAPTALQYEQTLAAPDLV